MKKYKNNRSVHNHLRYDDVWARENEISVRCSQKNIIFTLVFVYSSRNEVDFENEAVYP